MDNLSAEFRLNMLFLEKTLSLLDLELFSSIRKAQLSRLDETREGNNIISGAEAAVLALQRFGMREGADEKLFDEDETLIQAAHEKAYQSILDTLKEANALGIELKFMRIQRVFSLSDEQLSFLLVCLAPMLDQRYAKMYSYLQNNGNDYYLCADLIISLCQPDNADRLKSLAEFEEKSALRSHWLIEEISGEHYTRPLARKYRAANGLAEWLVNGWRASAYFGAAQELEESKSSFAETPFSMDIFRDFTQRIFCFIGEDLERMKQSALKASKALNMPCIILTLPEQAENRSAAVRIIGMGVRDGALNNAFLCVRGIEFWTDANKTIDEKISIQLEACASPLVLFSEKTLWLPQAEKPLIQIKFPPLKASDRLGIWIEVLRNGGWGDFYAQNKEKFRQFSDQFSLSSLQIEKAFQFVKAIALCENRTARISDFYQAARECSLSHLSDLAKKMEVRYSWDDLILPTETEELLLEMTEMAKNRAFVLEEWGAGKKLTSGAGISALFTGPPGTGKTLSAQVIAADLGQDLYRIDLSSIVSKYIGETEKNLEKIFSEAENSNAILFFDEADSIFGKRSEVNDAHDRYANIEVGYLLQRIETYDGIAILATNLGANLDEAFSRRINFIIDFPFPEAEYRERLWRTLIPKGVPMDEEIDFNRLAQNFKLSGGNIRNAIVNGIFRAAKNKRGLRQCDLEHGVMRELQKMGRVFKQ